MNEQGPPLGGRIRATRMLIDKGAARYDRNRHFHRLADEACGIWNEAHSDPAAVIARLRRALRSERRLGQAGHWSYDLNRHFGLLQALKAELARSPTHATAGADDGADADGAPAALGISDTGTETS